MKYRKLFAIVGSFGLVFFSFAYFLIGFDVDFIPHFSTRIMTGAHKIGEQFNPSSTKAKSAEKLVLFYTHFYHQMPWGNFSNCAYKCHISTDRKALQKSDAVLFGLFEAAREWVDEPLPDRRALNLSHQIWAFAISESPEVHTYKALHLKALDNIFNWSINYRLDSDVILTSGRFAPLLPDESTKYLLPDSASIQYKRQGVALISRCDAESGRDAYIKELQEHFPVDVYGRCGTFECNSSMNCYKILGEKYKFWLSFENSICKYYITEKFYFPFAYGALPVVYGYGPYSEVAPNHSYIDVRDYSSPQALAKYLRYLDGNHTAYLEYFQWRKQFKIIRFPDVWCNFCEKLHKTDVTTTRKWYSSVEDWYERNNTDVSVCLSGSEFVSSFWKNSSSSS